jgi:hypothetical protein
MNEARCKSDTAQTGTCQAFAGTRTAYRQILDQVPGCIMVADGRGQVVYANRVAVATLGRSLKELLGAGWLESLDPAMIDNAGKTWQRCIQTGEPLDVIWRFRQRDNTFRWKHMKANPTIDKDSNANTWYVLGLDVDEQYQAQEALKASEQMGTEVSAFIAHEINQPLTSVLVNAQACTRWLRMDPPKVEEAVGSVCRIVRDARAVDAVMRNVRFLFKRQASSKAPCNMGELIQDAVRLINEDVNRRFTQIEYDFENPALLVLADRHQLQQIIIDLIMNAIEAMQGSERSPSLRIRVSLSGESQVLTEFIDNGCGLPAQAADNIFDAFVTTKKQGMGIGLSISRTIVEAHGGRLWAENNPEFGAKFNLLLGVAEPITSGG